MTVKMKRGQKDRVWCGRCDRGMPRKLAGKKACRCGNSTWWMQSSISVQKARRLSPRE